MKNYVKLYYDSYSYEGEWSIPCEHACGRSAVEIDHILSRSIGGDPQGKRHRIENLMATCRECHIATGNQKNTVAEKTRKHVADMEINNVEFDRDYTDSVIYRYE